MFDDVWYGVERPGDIFADEEDIYNVIDFVDKCRENNRNNLLIHCYRGISRSSAIALIIYAYLGEPNPYRQVLRTRLEARPNLYILKLGLDILREQYDLDLEIDLEVY